MEKMVGSKNINNQASRTTHTSTPKGNPANMEVSSPPGQVQSPKAASTAASHISAAYQGEPRTVSQKSSEVLHQRGKIPTSSPVRLVFGGFVVAMALGYFTLFTKKKPEATAIDVAKVVTGSAAEENTRPSPRN